MSADEIRTDFDTFSNYPGVEGNEKAISDIEAHIASSHLTAFGSLEELRECLQAEPVSNKIGIITKGVKKRMILDPKVVGTKSCSAKYERVLLPRLLDAILQAMILKSKCLPTEDMEWFVVDFSDAFWQMPLHPEERRFFCARLTINGQVKYMEFLRTVQGHQHRHKQATQTATAYSGGIHPVSPQVLCKVLFRCSQTVTVLAFEVSPADGRDTCAKHLQLSLQVE